MFQFVLPLYAQTMGIVLLDFLGNGKSERVCRFPDELWIDQGMQVVSLCKALGYAKVNLIGTSLVERYFSISKAFLGFASDRYL